MELICYPLLGRSTKRLMERRYKFGGRWGKKQYHYRPQYRLIQRLMRELNLPEAKVREQLYKERIYLLRQKYGINEISDGEF